MNSNMLLTIRVANMVQLAVNNNNQEYYSNHPLLKPNANRLLYKYPSLQKNDCHFNQALDNAKHSPLFLSSAYNNCNSNNIINSNSILYFKSKQRGIAPILSKYSFNLSLRKSSSSFNINQQPYSVIKDASKQQEDIFDNIRKSIESFSKAIKVKHVYKDNNDENQAVANADYISKRIIEPIVKKVRSRNKNKLKNMNESNECRRTVNKKSCNYSQMSILPLLQRNISFDYTTLSKLVNTKEKTVIKDMSYKSLKKMDQIIKKLIINK